MKVFAFRDGKKAELLCDNAKRPNGLHGRFSTTGAFIESDVNEFGLQLGGDHGINRDKATEIDPATYNVPAVCYCMGQDSNTNEWYWHFTPTPEELKRMVETDYVRYRPHQMAKFNGKTVAMATILNAVAKEERDYNRETPNEDLLLMAITKYGWTIEAPDEIEIDYGQVGKG